MISLIASAACLSLAPSPGSLAAHIQLAEQRMSGSLVILAPTRFSSASATAILAIAAGSTRPLTGCSPRLSATPEWPNRLWP